MLGAELRTTMRANEPQNERKGDVMKKLLVILCVLVLLALVVVPVLVEALPGEGEMNRQMAPVKPGDLRKAEAPSSIQMAGYWRSPSA